VFKQPPEEDPRHLSGAAKSAPAPLPSYIRAAGAVRMVFEARTDCTRLIERADGGGYLVRTPHSRGATEEKQCQAVLINAGGGMAGGDRLTIIAEVREGAAAAITTQAAEKIYRSQAPPTDIDVSLTLASNSRLDWIPQETILFSGSRLRRCLTAALPDSATLTVGEAVVFGRVAMDEAVETGSVLDRWRISRNGTLIFADDLRLDDAPARRLSRRASGAGARALATILHIAPDAELRIEAAREMMQHGSAEGGASAWNGMLLLRFVSPDPQALRSHFITALEWLRGATTPRCW
jgi:urease accessory protein